VLTMETAAIPRVSQATKWNPAGRRAMVIPPPWNVGLNRVAAVPLRRLRTQAVSTVERLDTNQWRETRAQTVTRSGVVRPWVTRRRSGVVECAGSWAHQKL